MDTNVNKIRNLRNGHIDIYEPGLESLVKKNQQAGRLTFTTDLAAAVQQSTVVFIAVGTPKDEDGSADICHVMDAAKSIGAAITDYTVIINKSTVPVGTVARVRSAISDSTTKPFSVVSNPEFLKQGDAINPILAAAGYNFRLILKWIRLLWFYFCYARENIQPAKTA